MTATLSQTETEILSSEPGATYTCLALAVDAGMASDADARARYLAIYGEEWVPLYKRHAITESELRAVKARSIETAYQNAGATGVL